MMLKVETKIFFLALVSLISLLILKKKLPNKKEREGKKMKRIRFFLEHDLCAFYALNGALTTKLEFYVFIFL